MNKLQYTLDCWDCGPGFDSPPVAYVTPAVSRTVGSMEVKQRAFTDNSAWLAPRLCIVEVFKNLNNL